MILNTPNGSIEILEPTPEMIRDLQNTLPYGFFPFGQEVRGARYGFVVQCGDEEISCLKQQPVEFSRKNAMAVMNLHHCLILETYARLIGKRKYGSIYYATPYFKEKGEDSVESGIAHFIFPDPDDVNGHEESFYDRHFGKNSTALFSEFMDTFKECTPEDLRIGYIGLDIRTRSQLGSLASGFMLYRGNILYHGTTFNEQDPRFNILAKRGITRIYHVPSLPMTVSPAQLPVAKGDQPLATNEHNRKQP